jgi:hypothetical protein
MSGEGLSEEEARNGTSDDRRGQCDEYCYRVRIGSTNTFRKHIN